MIDLDPLKPLSDEFIDRIVDGELTPAELRDAIDRLDRRARWLEALRVGVSRSPMLARVVTGYRSTNADFQSTRNRRRSPLAATPSSQKPASWLRRATLAATVAASFVLGWVGHTWRPLIAPGHNSLAWLKPITVQQAQESEASSLDEPPLPAHTVSESTGEDRSPPNPSRDRPGSGEAADPFGDAKAEVPILAGPGIDSEWVQQSTAAGFRTRAGRVSATSGIRSTSAGA